jgi:hypothetical protein
VFLVGLVCSTLFVIGLMTLHVQSEVFEIGYDIESKRRELRALERENDALRIDLVMMTTPSSLFPLRGRATFDANGGKMRDIAPLMSSYHVLRAEAVRDRDRSDGSNREWGEVENAVENSRARRE